MTIINFFRNAVADIATETEDRYFDTIEMESFVVRTLYGQHLNFPKKEGFDYNELTVWGQHDYIKTVEITSEISNFLLPFATKFISSIKEEIKRNEEERAYRAKWKASLYNKVDNINHLTVSDSKCEGKHLIYKGYKITLWETADYDWNYYAKSYGHPKKTVEGREVLFFKKDKTQRIEINSFRTTDIIKGVAEFFKIPLAAKNKYQTNPYFEIKKFKDTAKYAVYTQTFGGVIVGYVVSDGKTTYHDDTKKAAIEGWKKKAALAQEKKEIKAGLRFTAAQLHEDYGFCWQGIHEFADACGLDVTKSYTQKELRTAFNKSPERRTLLIKYKSELSQIL